MLIKWNGVNVHALGTVEVKKTPGMPTAGSPNDIFWLRPGWNEFPALVWKMYEKHPEILRMLEDGKIELMSVAAGKKRKIGEGDEELHLTELEEKYAIKVLKDTHNRDMLQRWLDEETRHKVKRELEKQITPLLKTSQSQLTA